jgi:hypothetical protein
LFQRFIKRRTFLFSCLAVLVGLGLLYEVPRSHSDTPHSVELWKTHRPVAETFTWQYSTLTMDRDPCRRRDSNPQSQSRLRPRVHWYRQGSRLGSINAERSDDYHEFV